MSLTTASTRILEANPYHDKEGQFTSKDDAVTGDSKEKKSDIPSHIPDEVFNRGQKTSEKGSLKDLYWKASGLVGDLYQKGWKFNKTEGDPTGRDGSKNNRAYYLVHPSHPKSEIIISVGAEHQRKTNKNSKGRLFVTIQS